MPDINNILVYDSGPTHQPRTLIDIYGMPTIVFFGQSSTPVPSNTPPVVTAAPNPAMELDVIVPVVLEVTDAEAVERVRVFAEYPDGSYDVVWDGTRFAARYRNASYREVISNGYRFTVIHNHGWIDDPILTVDVSD